MKQATLCLLIKDNKVLLAMKKRGFGVGKWNGVGGKFDKEKDKDINEAAIREAKEEIGVGLINPEKMAILRFRFPYKKEWDQDVHVFLAKSWNGEPRESEEMIPRWFKIEEIPYDKMWDDDKLWLPKFLSGQKIEADFIFRQGEIIDKHNIKIVDKI